MLGPSSTHNTAVARDTFLPQSCNSFIRLKRLIKPLNGAKVSSQTLHAGGDEKLFEKASEQAAYLGGVDWDNPHQFKTNGACSSASTALRAGRVWAEIRFQAAEAGWHKPTHNEGQPGLQTPTSSWTFPPVATSGVLFLIFFFK